MSRITKWKMEKIKVKAVFRLQLQATHIPRSGWDKLFVSFIAIDTGKLTAKTSKASVRNGSCKWSDPIYETTRLLQDPKTKCYDEKLYKFMVAMGSSRSSLLGEVVINLADFVSALKPSSAALPLHGCDFGATLHVNVQLLTSKTGFKEFEQQRELSVKGFEGSSSKRIHVQNEDLLATSGSFECNDKVNASLRFKGDSAVLPLLDEVGELDEDSAAGVNCSSYMSEILHAEKNDFSGLTEPNGLKCRVADDVIGFTPVHCSSTEKRDRNYKHLSTQLSNDWSSDYSIDNDLASSYEDCDILAARLQATESSILQLKSEAMSLQSISDLLSSETQNLAQQLTVELASGEKLAREVDILKSEYWKFKDDLDELKAASSSLRTSGRKTPSALPLPVISAFENKGADSALDAKNNIHLSCDFYSRLLHEILLIECKVQQIQNEACFGYNGNGSKYIYSEFDVLGILIQNVKQSIEHELSAEAVTEIQTKKNQHSLSEQHAQVEDAGRAFTDLFNSEGIMEENMCELLEQLKVSKDEDESLARRMVKAESYYGAIIHELEDKQKQTLGQLENLRDEHSSCFYTISTLQNKTEKLHEELNDQLISFTEDRHHLESFIKELEKKAIFSETMLKRVRLNYAIAVDRLQNDLELLSFQVLSMYEANEILAKQALADATEQYCDEHSKEMELWHKGESVVSPNQEQQKPAHVDIQHDTARINGDHGLYAIFNGVQDEFNHKMLCNFSSKEESQETTERSLSMDLKLHVNEESNTSVNALKLHEISSAVSTLGIMQERKHLSFSHDTLMENQRTSCLLHSLHIPKPVARSQVSMNIKNMKDVYRYAAPDYSEISNRTETMENAYHSFPPGENMVDCIVCSKEREISVDFPKLLPVSSGAEILEVLMLNLQLEVHAQVLQETLREVSPEIGHLKGKIIELQDKIQYCMNNEEFLVLKLHTALDEARTMRECEEKCITSYNDLVSTSHIMEEKLNGAFNEKNILVQKMEDCHSLIVNSDVYESKYKICMAEKNELENMLKEEKSQRTFLQGKISSLIEGSKLMEEQYEKKCSLNSDLQKGVTDLRIKFGNLCKWLVLCNQQVDSILDDICFKEELDSENYDAIFSHLEQFQEKLSGRLFKLQQEKKAAEVQIEVAQCKLNERDSHFLYMKQKFESELEDVRIKLEISSTELEHLQVELQDAVGKFKLIEEAEELHRFENGKLLLSISILEVEVQQATAECRDFYQKILEALVLEASPKLLAFNEQNTEFCYLKTRVLELEKEMQQYVVFCNERDKVDTEISSLYFEVANMEKHLVAAFAHSVSADVELTFMKNQFCSKMAEFIEHQKISKSIVEELHLKNLDISVSLEKHIVIEQEFMAERERLSTDLLSAESTLEALFVEKEILLVYITENTVDLAAFKDLKGKAATSEVNYAKEKQHYEDEICVMLTRLEELDELWLAKAELDILVMFFCSKLREQVTHIKSLEQFEYELRTLREKHIDLTQKLSEQILKEEEFKTLSIHLKELKEKEDAECHQTHGKRESEGSSFAVQESLRIAFIKEQYEFKIQELTSQCSIFRNYADEILLKLQSSLNDNEIMKKSEAYLSKRNDELSILLSDLNTELQTVMTDRRELIKACNRMKTELECSILSLECCNEEKERLQNSLKESNEEREKIRVELDLVKRFLDNMSSTTGTGSRRNYEFVNTGARSIGELLEDDPPGISFTFEKATSALGICSVDKLVHSIPCSEANTMQKTCVNEDSFVCVSNMGSVLKNAGVERATLLENNATQIADIKEHFKYQQRLINDMEFFCKQQFRQVHNFCSESYCC